MRIIVDSAGHRYDGGHCRASVTRLYLQTSAELSKALPHPRYADAGALGPVGLCQGSFGVHPPPAVLDLQSDPIAALLEPDSCRATTGVALDVAQTLLDDPEEGRFHLRGETPDLAYRHQLDVDPAALDESVDVPL